MPVVVIEGPEPVVTAEEAKTARVFAEGDDDGYVDMLLAVAQSTIDGPNGWLRRAIGRQTLQAEYPLDCDIKPEWLPCPPFVEVVSDETVDCVRTVQYVAGYEVDDVPPAIKHAIMLMAAELKNYGDAVPLAIRRETVEGVGSTDYQVPAGGAEAMRKAADRLLSTFIVYR